MQRVLGDAGLGGDDAEGVALGLQQPRVSDRVFGVGDRPSDLPACGSGDGAGGAFGGEGAFHLCEQRQQQEDDAGHALVGGVDRQRVGQRPPTDPSSGKVVEEVEDPAQIHILGAS